MLAKIAMESMLELGEEGRKALYSTGKKFGDELILQELKRYGNIDKLTFDQKLNILKHVTLICQDSIQNLMPMMKGPSSIFKFIIAHLKKLRPGMQSQCAICTMNF